MEGRSIALVESLPPFKLLADIIKAFARLDGAYTNRELLDSINREPSIAAKVIAVANSAYYHPARPICDVGNAIMHMGLKQTQALLLKIILSERFPTDKCKAFEVERYWYDSMMVAHCSGHIYKHLSSKPSIKQEELYTFGLLNSIGLLLMVYQYPDEMHQVFEQNVLESLLDAERQYFDNNHYQVGARLLDHWGLPSIFYEVLSALGSSENIDNDAACIANILRLTQAIVNYLYHDRPAPTLENWESIGLESSIIDEIRASFIEVNAEVTYVMQLLV